MVSEEDKANIKYEEQCDKEDSFGKRIVYCDCGNEMSEDEKDIYGVCSECM